MSISQARQLRSWKVQPGRGIASAARGGRAVALWLTLLVAAAGGRAMASDEEPWMTDAAAAAEMAREETRDMLLLFTGSDWCAPCIRLENTILSQQEFLDGAREKFILVKFDFPQETPVSEALQKQNQAWSDRYGVEGFPTLVLVDENQKPYAFTGFREESPAAYLTHLEELQQTRIKRDEFLAEAAAASGLERAELLDQAMAVLDPLVVEVYYTEIVEEIGTLDGDDQAGLRTKYFAERDREIRKAVMSNISMVARLRKPPAAIEFIDEMLAEHKLPTGMWVSAQTTKLRLLRRLERVDEANALVDEMIRHPELDPETRQRLVINKAYYLVSQNDAAAALALLQQFIAESPENLLLTIARGELHDSLGQFEEAIAAYDQAMVAAASRPQILVELVGAKADAQFELKQVDEALATLDGIIANEAVPGRLRAEALLHKALVLRETGRRRAAILAENKAIEMVGSVEEKAGIQKLVDQFRRKFDRVDDSN